MRHFIFLLVASTALADPKPGTEGTPELKQATELVKQLGHARYAVREAAAKKLLELGPAAVPALTAGTESPDEEVRNRSRALLPQARAVEWQRRAAAYLADAEGKQKHDLPLLAEWEKLVGKPDAGSRKVFAEMVRTNGEFLLAASSRKDGIQAVQDRSRVLLSEVRSTRGQIKAAVPDLAALLFADLVAKEDGAKRGWPEDWYRNNPGATLSNPAWPDAVGSSETGPTLRKLLVNWAEAKRLNDGNVFTRFAMLVQKKPFPEAAPILAKMAKDKKLDVLSTRMVAVQTLGKVGGKEAIETLAGLIDDKSNVFGGSPDEYTFGDSAFGALLTASGKKLNDFGIDNQGGIGFSTGDDDEMISLNLYRFRTAEARAKGLKKWKDEAAKKEEKKEEKK